MKNTLLTVVLFIAGTTGVHAGDWPTWRYDAARSAASPADIAEKPVLLWSLKLPPVRQAWPLEPNQRLNFDASYEPVVMGKRLFLGSPNDGSVTAYDTATGAEKWKFFTEGPVRCAPACWASTGGAERVFAGSDDGYLYCLDAQTGALVWKFRGAPAERPDRRQLGNEHLVSFWPVRGGPVIENGVVYFGAGIWPIFGVFMHAVDAGTGKARWSNGTLNNIAKVRAQAAFKMDTGLSPQGYLALLHGKLAIPCGRSLPAGIEAATGKLIYYDQGTQKGECRIALHGDYAFVGQNGMVDLNDFCEFGNRSQATGKMPYKLVAGCDASSAFDNGVAYGLVNGIFYAYDLVNAKTVMRQCPGPWGPIRMLRWEAPVCWQYQLPYSGPLKTRDAMDGRPWGYDAAPRSSVTLKAGKRLYGSVGQKLIALDNPAGPPRIAWEKTIDGTPSSMIAADDKLFVATAEGGLYCFGEGTPVKRAAKTTPPPETPGDSWSNRTARIVSASGAAEGYGLVLGLAEGRLIDELLRQTRLTVFAVDADAVKVEALRRRYAAAGLLGARVELFVGKPFEFLFPPYLANLIVSEDARAAGFPVAADAAKLFACLHPYGGAICLETPPDMAPSFAAWAGTLAAAGASLKPAGDFSLLTRPGPLPGSASWTHLNGDAANTFCSQDELVKAPLGFLWYADVPMAWPEYPSGYLMKFAASGGRIYQQGMRGKNVLISVYDAYTGRPLWSTNFPTLHRRGASVMMPDGVYLVVDSKCMVFAPDTGRELNTFPFLIEKQVATGLRVTDDIILIACTLTEIDATRAVLHNYLGDVSSTLVCLDRRTGAELWRRKAAERFDDKALAVGKGMVFVTDSLPLYLADKAAAKPEDVKQLPSTILALDARTGAEQWSKTISYDSTRTLTQDDHVSGVDDGHIQKPYGRDWLSYVPETDMVVAGRFFVGSGFEARTGKPRWEQKEIRGTAPMVVRGKTIVTSGGRVYDALTGNLTTHYPGVRKVACNYAVASKHLIMIRLNNASYYDVAEDKSYQLRNIRSSCMNNLIAADGLVNSPCFTPGDCNCNFPIQTSFALLNMPEVDEWAGSTPLTMPTPPPRTPPPQAQPAATGK